MKDSKTIKVNIKNCNNIIDGTVEIDENKLNIKYAINGTGKSTLAKAIKIKLENGNLNLLKPFTTSGIPEITIDKPISKVLIFDEEFVNNIVFKEDEVISNSFEIFIKTGDYDSRREQLNQRLKELKVDIAQNQDIMKMIAIFDEVSKKLVLNKQRDSINNNPFVKSLFKKENLYNIPERLWKYKSFIENDNFNIDWIDWKNKGYNYENEHMCPFCSENLAVDYEEEKDIFIETYDKGSTRNLKDMLNFFKLLKEYIKEDKYIELNNYVKKCSDQNDLKLILTKFSLELDYLKVKIEGIISFDSYKIKNEEISELNKKVENLKIDTNLDIFNSPKALDIIEQINRKISNVYNEVEYLKKEVGKLKGFVEAAVKKSTRDINSFLESAGINYEISIIVEDEERTKTILQYKGNGVDKHDVDNIKQHLSWGEKNAFSLMLFMYYALSQDVDIIILDDPISSFDSNKKYAIINRLFKNTTNVESLYRKTVLMLTHDFEPIIDFTVNHKPTGGFVSAHFLKNDFGVLKETLIDERDDIKPLIKMLLENAKNKDLNIVHRVIFLRKYIEHVNQTDLEAITYDILSSLIHGKEQPDKKIGEENYENISNEELVKGYDYIRSYIEDFDYEKNRKQIYSSDNIISYYENESNAYLKLQLFREYLEIKGIRDKIQDDVVLKFIDDIYHIENDYLYCLDFLKFDIVPSYIFKRINYFIESEKKH